MSVAVAFPARGEGVYTRSLCAKPSILLQKGYADQMAFLWGFMLLAAPASAAAATPEVPPPAPLSAASVPPLASPLAAPAPVEKSACASEIPALTPVKISLDAELGSKTSTTGAMFPLHLAEALVINGCELVPAGTKGMGEIVHAKKAGGSGAPGELVLAARYLTIGEAQLKLRSMRIAVAGADSIHAVDGLNAASVMSPLPIGSIGFAISGRNIVLPIGTLAIAKTAAPFSLVTSPAGPSPSQGDQTTSTDQGGVNK